jgi:hypothetical protein
MSATHASTTAGETLLRGIVPRGGSTLDRSSDSYPDTPPCKRQSTRPYRHSQGVIGSKVFWMWVRYPMVRGMDWT